MKKSFLTNVFTLAIATSMVVGSSVFAAQAFPKSTAKPVVVTSKSEQTKTKTIISDLNSSKVQISQMEDAKDMALLRTSKDMNKEKAVEISMKALEKKFGISSNGMYATPIFCTREDSKEMFYFVSFVTTADLTRQANYVGTDPIIKNKMADIKKSNGADIKNDGPIDVYIAFVNSKTGEVISAEKNPSAPEGTN